MSTTVTRSELRDRIRRAADEPGTTRISDADVNDLITRGHQKIWDVIYRYGGSEYSSSAHFVTVPGINEYTLETLSQDTSHPIPNFYKLLTLLIYDEADTTVDPYTVKVGTVGWTAEPMMWDEYADVIPERTRWTRNNVRYHLRSGIIEPGGGDQTSIIVFTPVPDEIHFVQMFYLPSPQVFTLDTDKLADYNGWSEYVVHYGAREIAIRNQDPSINDHAARMREEEDRIRGNVRRDHGGPRRATDHKARFWGSRRRGYSSSRGGRW